jgi:hypothetical protein
MKIRKLKRRAGEAVMSPWPPQVLTGSGTTFTRPGEGVLKSVKRIGNRLSLIIEHEKRDAFASLEWDAPPTLDEVERVLQAQIGTPIKAIGDVDVTSK